MFHPSNATYVFQDTNTGLGGGWVPLNSASSAAFYSLAVSSRTFGLTTPFVSEASFTEVGAGQISASFTISLANPAEPKGLFTIASAYAMNAALTALVPARMVDETAATLVATANAAYRVASIAYAYNGAAFVRALTGSAANLSAQSASAALLTQAPGEWAITSTPAANTQATVTRAAGAAGVRHVCKSISATLIGLAASVEATVLVNLRDGTTGAGTILWSARLLVVGVTGSQAGIVISNINITGTAATAMTLEFAAAGGANTFETVALTGVDAS